jgi:hypothetical protein
VKAFAIGDCQLPIEELAKAFDKSAIENQQSAMPGGV